jgi:hypothetical protein
VQTTHPLIASNIVNQRRAELEARSAEASRAARAKPLRRIGVCARRRARSANGPSAVGPTRLISA